MIECAYCSLDNKQPATALLTWLDENGKPDVSVYICDNDRKRVDRFTPGPDTEAVSASQ